MVSAGDGLGGGCRWSRPLFFGLDGEGGRGWGWDWGREGDEGDFGVWDERRDGMCALVAVVEWGGGAMVEVVLYLLRHVGDA